MSDTGLANMVSASQDHLIDAIDFSRLGRPTASYVVDRRTVQVPFLAPSYSVDGVQVMRCTIADPGWIDPATVYMSCLVHNDESTPNSMLRPLTTSVNGCFQRGRLMSGQTIEDVLEYAKVSTIYDWLKPEVALEETEKVGFPTRRVAGLRELSKVFPGKSKRVQHKPIFGLLQQNKYLPTGFMPLTFEFTLTHDAASWRCEGISSTPFWKPKTC